MNLCHKGENGRGAITGALLAGVTAAMRKGKKGKKKGVPLWCGGGVRCSVHWGLAGSGVGRRRSAQRGGEVLWAQEWRKRAKRKKRRGGSLLPLFMGAGARAVSGLTAHEPRNGRAD